MIRVSNYMGIQHGGRNGKDNIDVQGLLNATNQDENSERVATATVESVASVIALNITQVPSTLLADVKKANQHQDNCSPNRSDNEWIIDSGTIDHMTFNQNYFSCVNQPRRSMISNANDVHNPIRRVENVILSLSLSLSNALLIPSLSNKLLSMNQITIDFNRVLYMYPTFCLLRIFSQRR